MDRATTSNPTALKEWLDLAELTAGPLFRKVNRGGAVETARLSADRVRHILLKRAAAAGMSRGRPSASFTIVDHGTDRQDAVESRRLSSRGPGTGG